MKKTATIVTLFTLAMTMVGCHQQATVTVNALQNDGTTENIVIDSANNVAVLPDDTIGVTATICGDKPEEIKVTRVKRVTKTKTIENEDLWYIIPGIIVVSTVSIISSDCLGNEQEEECWDYTIDPELLKQPGTLEVTVELNADPLVFYLICPENGNEGEGEGEPVEGEAPVYYVLTTSVEGQGSVTGAGTYPAGTTVHVTASPANDWSFSHWVVNNTQGTTNPSAQVTMDSDVDLLGVFVYGGSEGEGEGEGEPPVNTYRLTTAIEGDGLIVANPIGPDYEVGTVVTLTAVAQNESVFDRWSGDLSTSSNPVTITMSRDRSVTAWFSTPIANDGPVINVQPHSITREVGDEARFEVQAAGSNLHYQWRMNLVDLDPTECAGWSEGWNGPVLTIFHVGEINEGGYSCRIWNSHGTVETEVATLYVNDYGAPPTIWFEWNTAKTTPICMVDFVGLTESQVASMFLAADGMTSINVSRLHQATALRVHHFREWAPPWHPVDDVVISGNWWNQILEITLVNWNSNATGSGDNDRRIRTNLSLVFPDGAIAYLDVEMVLFLLGDDTPINIERGAADFSMPAP